MMHEPWIDNFGMLPSTTWKVPSWFPFICGRSPASELCLPTVGTRNVLAAQKAALHRHMINIQATGVVATHRHAGLQVSDHIGHRCPCLSNIMAAAHACTTAAACVQRPAVEMRHEEPASHCQPPRCAATQQECWRMLHILGSATVAKRQTIITIPQVGVSSHCDRHNADGSNESV